MHVHDVLTVGRYTMYLRLHARLIEDDSKTKSDGTPKNQVGSLSLAFFSRCSQYCYRRDHSQAAGTLRVNIAGLVTLHTYLNIIMKFYQTRKRTSTRIIYYNVFFPAPPSKLNIFIIYLDVRDTQTHQQDRLTAAVVFVVVVVGGGGTGRQRERRKTGFFTSNLYSSYLISQNFYGICWLLK